MARLAILAIAVAAALAVAGCGDDGDNGSDGGATTSGEATQEKSGGDAMKNDSDAMKDEGDAMKNDGDAMKEDSSKSGDAMKDDDDAMKDDDDAMKDDGDAMKDETSAETGAMVASTSAKRGKIVKVVGSNFGRVIADGKGEAYYLFGKEKGSKSRCYGACARAWPPVITKGKPRARRGAKARLLGTTKRRNGKRQVTYKGHPLYYYVDDSPGTILCQDVAEFGGRWLVVKPNGNPVT